MPHTVEQPRGFTLIELMIVIAVIGVAAAAAVPAVSSITGANARAAAGELAGAMRWMFDTAAMRHESCRLALDIDHATWWAECTQTRPGERRMAVALPVDAAAREEDDEALAERFPDEKDSERRRLLAQTRFGAYQDRLVKKRELPGSSVFQEVWIQHQREPQVNGIAYLYFFPQGQAEAARVPIVDGGSVYSVVLQPFTGHARVVNGKPEVPR
jgi:general secretion pathway protein H